MAETITELPAGALVTVKVKTNSRHPQKVRFWDDLGGIDYVFSGAGAANTEIGRASLRATGQPYSVDFAYSGDGDGWQQSIVKRGGPYDIGSYHLLVLVAENGDDADYNDAIVEFSWYAPN
ncbi:fucose-binding lectin II [Nocardia xishanensis]